MIKRIFLLPMSHCDLGYTDFASEVRRKHVGHLHDVIALCKATENNPDGLKFKWTCEAAWTVKEFLAHAGANEQSAFFHYVRTGQIEVGGFFGILQFELASLEELIRCCEYSSVLGQAHGFGIRTAIINDVPGVHSGVSEVLAGFGIPYLLWGPNAFRNLVGWTELPSLFYLQSKGGKRTLVWHNGQDHRISPWESPGMQSEYSFGDQYVISPYRQAKGIRDEGNLSFVERTTVQAKGRQALDELLAKMEFDRYPYDALILQCAADNRGPDPQLVATVESLNRDYSDLTFAIATPAEAFRYLENKYAPNIPTFSGDFIDSWTDGAGASAEATAAYRRYQTQVERLEWALARADDFPRQTVSLLHEVYESLLLYSEHTFGLRGWSWRTLNKENLVQSWREKTAFVRHAGRILEECPKPAAPSPAAAPGDDLICRFPVMENRFYRLTLSPSGQIESILDKELNRELVDPRGRFPFNALIFTRLTGLCEDFPGKGAGKCDPVQTQTFVADLKNARMERHSDGVTLTGEYTLDHPPIRLGGTMAVVLYANQKRIDFVNTLDKEESPDKEALYFSFPFNLRKNDFDVRLEMAGHLSRFPDDLLSCSHADFVGIRHLACLADDAVAVTWVTHDAPLVELGDIQTFRWRPSNYRPVDPLLLSYVMNNTWSTNFHLWQGGRFTFRYSLTSSRTFDPVACYAFKRQILYPELADFDLQPDNVVLAGVRVREDRTVDLRLLEVAGKSGIGHLTWPGVTEPWLTDLAGRRNEELSIDPEGRLSFPYAAHGLINLRLSRKDVSHA